MNDGDELIVPPDVVYVTYIRTTPREVWDALTQSAFTKQFFFGRTVESDWKQGSPWRLVMPDGRTDVAGEVLVSDQPRKLQVTWFVEWLHDAPKEPTIITYDIEPVGELVKLTMTQHTDAKIPRKFLEAGKQGWAAILSSLKSLLETGEALTIKMNPPE
ncbi:MAG: SRPBCC family protein [Proteobacteria bacterium]|nr:SRPBCC family protein [Pseudomonadota bacterium]